MANPKDHKEHMNVEDALTQSEAFIIKHKNLIIGVVAGIVLIVAGVLLYKNLYAEPREAKAQAALVSPQSYFEMDQYEWALNGDSITSKGFLKIADEFSGTDAANLSHYYAGICYMQLGDYLNAIKELNKFSGDDALVAPAALAALGNSYAELEQLDKASSFLLKAADKADNLSLSPIYLVQAGEILLKQGKYDDAVAAYTKVKEKYAQSFQAMEIDKYIEKAKLLKK